MATALKKHLWTVDTFQDPFYLTTFLSLENPCTEEDNYRTEVLIILRRLVRLDKDEYSDEDRTDAEELHNQRKQEDFKEKEEEEAEEED